MTFYDFEYAVNRTLQTIAAAMYILIMTLGGPLGLLIAAYLIVYTYWRWPVILYLIWLWCIDINICEKGGRRFEWVRDWAWWKYLKDYFPLTLEKVTGVQLDPKRNYLFCCFPHGIVSTGAFSAFNTNISGFHKLFPHHTPYLMTLKENFIFPFHRDLGLAIGGCCASAKSISYLLNMPDGGQVAALVVGGARETFNCDLGRYKVILKNRKGFVKIAMRNGAPLVPVISFGETDIFSQLANPEGSLTRKIQEAIRKRIGFAPAIPIGRGYTLLPLRKPITTLVGPPIEVEKIDEPTNEQIDDLHEKFVTELTRLFEENKHVYLKNFENVKLEIE